MQWEGQEPMCGGRQARAPAFVAQTPPRCSPARPILLPQVPSKEKSDNDVWLLSNVTSTTARGW